MKDEKGSKDEIRVVRTSDHRSHYIIGGIASVTEDDVRLHVYNEVVESSAGEFYISNAQLIMSKACAQRIQDVLKGLLSADIEGPSTRVVAIPQSVALGMEKKDDARPRKKVQKIRVK
ncbi:MAG: hypothetical protein QCI82_01635 [Candidatus Thermoplasmatota archaeon]|nr:hypothetical protein [Candidatus Thermoplasmatota archaeon]